MKHIVSIINDNWILNCLNIRAEYESRANTIPVVSFPWNSLHENFISKYSNIQNNTATDGQLSDDLKYNTLQKIKADKFL